MAARTARTAVGHRRRLRDQVGPLMAQTRLTAASPRKETVSTSHHGRLSTPGEAGRRLAGIEYRITSRSELDGHAGVLEHLPLAQAERMLQSQGFADLPHRRSLARQSAISCWRPGAPA